MNLSDRKKILLTILLSVAVLIGYAAPNYACVGRILYIGSLKGAEPSVLSGLFSALINERTGTTVKIRYYDKPSEIMDGMKAGEVDIMVEYTGNALVNVLGEKPEKDNEKALSALKDGYQKRFNLVWLKPLSFSNPDGLWGGAKGQAISAEPAPVMRLEVLNQFPALPRVMQKLSGKVELADLKKMAKEVDGGEKPDRVARDFLRLRKLI